MSFWSHLAAVAAFSLAACQSVRTQPPTLDEPVNLSINAPESAIPTPTPPPPTAAPVQYSYSSVPGVGRVVAMTFDDGPSEKLTPMLLDILKQRNIHATFFVVGQNAAQYPDILKRAVAEGHEIGNHSWSHPQLTAMSMAGVKEQIEKTSAAIKAAIGYNPVLMRPPYGATSVRLDKLFNDTYGMKVILWSVDPLDWKYRNAERVKREILAQVTPGAIVLSHDIHATTVAAMPGTLDALQAAGYKFVTVSELIAMKKEAAPATPPPTTSPNSSAAITVPTTPTPTPAPTVPPYKVDRYDSTPASDGSASQ